MICSIITPEQQNISIQLPQNFVGKKVEVIAFIIDDTKEKLLVNEEHALYVISENVLVKDWLTAEEDKAWQNL